MVNTMEKCESCDGDGYTMKDERDGAYVFGHYKEGCHSCGGKGDTRPRGRMKFKSGSGLKRGSG